MISPEHFYHQLRELGAGFFTGVPDSLFKDFLLFLQQETTNEEHIIAANEGLAAALAVGYHFATGRLPVVYLQNSGLGNLINPLTSLADPAIYAVPMLLLVGWRGRPGITDEPQHQKMGRITPSLLTALELPFYILTADQPASFALLETAVKKAVSAQCPVAVLIPEDIFAPLAGREPAHKTEVYQLSRETVIRQLVRALHGDEAVICTTGKSGREFNEANIAASHKIKKQLLCVGGMGHAGQIALMVSKNTAHKTILLDGDGALLMHMGSMTTTGQLAGDNLLHLVINNGAHESVGGQPTNAFNIDLCRIALSCGYDEAICLSGQEALTAWLDQDLHADNRKTFVEIRTDCSSRKDLSRPSGTPVEWKNAFMAALKKDK